MKNIIFLVPGPKNTVLKVIFGRNLNKKIYIQNALCTSIFRENSARKKLPMSSFVKG